MIAKVRVQAPSGRVDPRCTSDSEILTGEHEGAQGRTDRLCLGNYLPCVKALARTMRICKWGRRVQQIREREASRGLPVAVLTAPRRKRKKKRLTCEKATSGGRTQLHHVSSGARRMFIRVSRQAVSGSGVFFQPGGKRDQTARGRWGVRTCRDEMSCVWSHASVLPGWSRPDQTKMKHSTVDCSIAPKR